MRTFDVGDLVAGDTDAGRFFGVIMEVPSRPEGYYKVRWDGGEESALTWGSLHYDEPYHADYRTVAVTLPFDSEADDASVRDYVLDALLRAGVNVYEVSTPGGD